MKKYIHYCWFGGKPLPKLAKKCIKSWKKYLPDFEIIEWNEQNFDINITNFSRDAFKNKKWAFVSDVARIYALKEYGGIYFDTDMIVTKNIDELLKDEVFAGWESEFNVAVGVLYSKNKNHPLINKLWDFYKENDFDEENMYALSIPTLLSNILKNQYNLKFAPTVNQNLKDGIKIYSRDYFYPISCDKTPNQFTKNTCMIHYYIGSWVNDANKKKVFFEKTFGKKIGNFILKILVIIKRIIKKFIKLILFPYISYKRKKEKKSFIENFKNSFDLQFEGIKDKDYVVFYNNNWLGTKNATIELFDYVIGIDELYEDEIIDYMSNKICNSNIKFVAFSAFSHGWDILIERIKNQNPSIIIKVIWHGSLALNVENYDYEMFMKIFKLYNEKFINKICFIKKSMYDYFTKKGYNCDFLYNKVNISNKEKYLNFDKKNDGFIRIGLYASGDRWVKNFYNQLAAASLFDKAIIDCVPIDEKSLKLARLFEIGLNGLNTSISREALFRRMAKNDINFYVTFTECAPLIPLESLELGVPCITSNNHHYWKDTKLEKYLVVEKADNVNAIYKKASYCLEHKDEVLELYKDWKKNNDKESIDSVKKFLERNDD